MEQVKTELHPRNRHRQRYNFDNLTSACNTLKSFVKPNKYGDLSIDFFDPQAVKTLNKAILKHHYKIEYWEIPNDYLCPPIPGRADYIHYVADLIGNNHKITCLDIGTGANCIYPIIGATEYGWSFIASDIDSTSIKNAKKIISQNKNITNKIQPRLQHNAKHFFKGILKENEKIDLSICNPPFHSSRKEATDASSKKIRNLKRGKKTNAKPNFAGQSNELWCKGGEVSFITNMIIESETYSQQCKWFTTLVSKSSNLKTIYKKLEEVNAKKIKTIPMGQGNKISRIVAWTFQ